MQTRLSRFENLEEFSLKVLVEVVIILVLPCMNFLVISLTTPYSGRAGKIHVRRNTPRVLTINFTQENRKFQLENQMVHTIPFGKLPKIWAEL